MLFGPGLSFYRLGFQPVCASLAEAIFASSLAIILFQVHLKVARIQIFIIVLRLINYNAVCSLHGMESNKYQIVYAGNSGVAMDDAGAAAWGYCQS